jgi:ArsR family transcriptional regulator, arsenate/arsenite/antimonite-responsive transcriptional repressor
MKRRVKQLAALGQEDRLRIFRLLVRAGLQGKCVDEVKRTLKMPGSTLSHHLDTLTRSGLCTAHRSGRFIYYAVNCRETSNLIRYLTEDCCADMHARLDPPDTKARDNRRNGCCAENQPALPRVVSRVAKA